ncbi:MAG: sugar ABC transporter ATP-binding protein [Caldilineaceae bacterium]|nr:sugar ABC transporter ATP-binding protein [Caldilineaceae bacterium]MBP8109179.1 sugar ABC transporter ATP-binding protein [Caldilineaceae bacterium]MBP8122576.1 sugar ABC transporter ATP-binding protein [Caldilineaceae bacterium]MBP9074159.1 sugar ABC transporter ATP-binding protein [Caldilineaceae bacterium]
MPYLHMQSISKSFPGVRALQDVSFELAKGEIHALVGENGAGKSTLMKILTGAYKGDSGEIILDGRSVVINSPGDAQALGISMIHQELSLIPYLTVGQNIYLGREPRGRLPGIIDWPTLNKEAQALLDRLSVGVNATDLVEGLSIAQQQMVEVAKALSLNADIIAMDEPTSSLTDRETEVLFRVMGNLRDQGVALIYISHRLDEVFAITDRVTVLRDGQWIATLPTAELDEEKIVAMMVGRDLGELYPKKSGTTQGDVLTVTDLEDGDELRGVSFTLRRGEILGIAGLVGAGRTALAETLFGVRPATAGEIRMEGTPVRIKSPGDAMKLGLGLVPEDRKQQGLFLNMAVRENVTMSAMHQVTTLGFVSNRRADSMAKEYVKRLDIRTPGILQRVGNLSGGNQQKVVIARWLTLHPKVLMLDEPTRGIDVGAKAEIHGLMDQLAQQGVGVLMISSELPEVLGVADRILVMHEGRITGEFSRDEATQDAIMRAATGTNK